MKYATIQAAIEAVRSIFNSPAVQGNAVVAATSYTAPLPSNAPDAHTYTRTLIRNGYPILATADDEYVQSNAQFDVAKLLKFLETNATTLSTEEFPAEYRAALTTQIKKIQAFLASNPDGVEKEETKINLVELLIRTLRLALMRQQRDKTAGRKSDVMLQILCIVAHNITDQGGCIPGVIARLYVAYARLLFAELNFRAGTPAPALATMASATTSKATSATATASTTTAKVLPPQPAFKDTLVPPHGFAVAAGLPQTQTTKPKYEDDADAQEELAAVIAASLETHSTTKAKAKAEEDAALEAALLASMADAEAYAEEDDALTQAVMLSTASDAKPAPVYAEEDDADLQVAALLSAAAVQDEQAKRKQQFEEELDAALQASLYEHGDDELDPKTQEFLLEAMKGQTQDHEVDDEEQLLTAMALSMSMGGAGDEEEVDLSQYLEGEEEKQPQPSPSVLAFSSAATAVMTSATAPKGTLTVVLTPAPAADAPTTQTQAALDLAALRAEREARNKAKAKGLKGPQQG